jgi:hypothetical protein
MAVKPSAELLDPFSPKTEICTVVEPTEAAPAPTIMLYVPDDT